MKEKPNIEQMKSYLEIRPKEKVGEKQSKKENMLEITEKDRIENWKLMKIMKRIIIMRAKKKS